MRSGPKKGWNSVLPFRLRVKSATRFCMFSKVRSAGLTPGNAPVYLNVYDLTPMNGYVYWAGLGIFHSGVEVHGVEYAFGAHDYPTSGVFEVEPRQCPGFKFRKSIFMGTTCLDPMQIREFMERHSASYNGDTYHLIVKNCNHFCKDICYKLTGNSIPKWVNRLARIVWPARRVDWPDLWARSSSTITWWAKHRRSCKIWANILSPFKGQDVDLLAVQSHFTAGSVCNCVLPASLQVSAVRHDPSGYEPYHGEKRRLRSSFNCFSSISMRQKQFSRSSLFLGSPLKGCLPPWELRRSNNSSLKER